MSVPSTMTAAVTLAHGGAEQLEVRSEWPCPQPVPGQALVRVTGAGLNNTDIWPREGAYGTAADADAVVGWKGVPPDFPRIQGIDIVGRISAVGGGVDAVWLDTRVIVDPAARYVDDLPRDIVGSEVDGGFAEYHLCSVAQLHDVSESPLTDRQLACLPTAYGTALGMIDRAACAPGELVTGSSGGVGMAAIQLLLHRGCEVVARTKAAHRDLIADLGVAEVSVRDVDQVRDLRPVDAVVDVVGGDEFASLVERLRDKGRLVTAGAIGGPVVSLDLRRLYLQQRTLIGSTMHTPADFRRLAEIANAGGVHPIVAATYPLAEIATAQARFVSRDFVGKLVVVP